MRDTSFHYQKGKLQAGKLLIDERNTANFVIQGFDELEKQLDETNRTEISEAMLKAAEPIIKSALDAEMTRHPGPLQQSLRSTGARRNSAGQWYLAYRATNGNERESDNRRNTEKIVFLINLSSFSAHLVSAVKEDSRVCRLRESSDGYRIYFCVFAW